MISNNSEISKTAKIAEDVTIGPFCVIGDGVEIDSGSWIGSNVVINGPTKIGKNNKIYQFASIGEDCQDKKYNGELTYLEIGDNNVFREGCSIHRGTVQGGGITKIGHNNLFMGNTHIAHDCIVGNNIVFSNCASLAGHVKVGDYASLGGLAGVHQFCSIGAYSIVAGGSIIFKDILPFVKVSGYPAKTFGLNLVGLERNNFSEFAINTLKKAYKIIFKDSFTVKDAITKLEVLSKECSEILILLSFLKDSERGIVR